MYTQDTPFFVEYTVFISTFPGEWNLLLKFILSGNCFKWGKWHKWSFTVTQEWKTTNLQKTTVRKPCSHGLHALKIIILFKTFGWTVRWSMLYYGKMTSGFLSFHDNNFPLQVFLWSTAVFKKKERKRKRNQHEPPSLWCDIGFWVCLCVWVEEKWHLHICRTIKQCLCDLSAGFRHSFHDVICATASCRKALPRLAALQPSVTDTLFCAFQQMFSK